MHVDKSTCLCQSRLSLIYFSCCLFLFVTLFMFLIIFLILFSVSMTVPVTKNQANVHVYGHVKFTC